MNWPVWGDWDYNWLDDELVLIEGKYNQLVSDIEPLVDEVRVNPSKRTELYKQIGKKVNNFLKQFNDNFYFDCLDRSLSRDLCITWEIIFKCLRWRG